MAKLALYKVKKAYLGYPQGAVVQLSEEDAKTLLKEKVVELLKTKKASSYSKKA